MYRADDVIQQVGFEGRLNGLAMSGKPVNLPSPSLSVTPCRFASGFRVSNSSMYSPSRCGGIDYFGVFP